MPKYNLDALGHEEFERLCQCLVQKIIGPGVKVYGMGSDGAREATFHGKAPYPSSKEQWDGSWIFQAKFHDVRQVGPKEAQRRLLAELENELSIITEKYKHPCDNFILITNISLTPVFQKGVKDKIDNEIIPKYHHAIKHIHVWGADEICRFLDAHPNIRQSYAHLLVCGDIIAYLLGLIEREETELDELVKLYCEGCFIHERYAALDDAGDVEDKPVALHRVFIDLNVGLPALFRHSQILERLPTWLKQATEDDERTSALSYALDDSIPGLVLVGGPGEGKSTLGQYVAQIHRARLIGKLTELGENVEGFETCIPRVTFSVLLREYAQWVSSRNDSDSLFHYLAIQVSRESGRDAYAEDIHKIVKANSVLLILDGLDEVPEKRLRKRVLDNITSFVSQARDVLKGDLRVIATTRPHGYSEEFDPTHYLHLPIQKLSSEKVVLYARLWAAAREPRSREAERILKTVDLCLEDKVVKVLTQTPLQVTILLVIIRARGSPPKQREELFERYMDIIYQREQKNRPELLRTEQDIIYGLHKYLAYILHWRAEEDRTAALMDVSEFRKRVEEYLVHSNPLLKEKELETRVDQIIREARQRLVLIESLQEGKVGFGLTTTREFFAASHLVDTAKDTRERDLRFKAIARSPHWRNVALFFAGRVGRTRPGEAPSMIDVCREIDTEAVDIFLKRGAELVTEMVCDRVLREPHNEIGAIQYGLTLFDRGFVTDLRKFINELKSLPEQYKVGVIRPWIEERLKNVMPENLGLYADACQELFGCLEPLRVAIKRASESNSKETKLWALNKAIENRVVEEWVIKLLEELVEVVPIRKLSRTLSDHWSHLRLYLIFPVSLKARLTVVSALIEGIERRLLHGFGPSEPELIHELTEIRPNLEPRENFLYLWAVCQLLIIYRMSRAKMPRRRFTWPYNFFLPSIVSPDLKETIDKNRILFEDFCKTFSKENEPFTDLLIAIYEFLLDPHNPEKRRSISKKSHAFEDTETATPFLKRLVASIIGSPPAPEEKQYEFHKNIHALYQYYESEEQYEKDIEELNELINRQSVEIRHHPHKLYMWMQYNNDPRIEKFLDPKILSELKSWIQHRRISKSIFSFFLHFRSLRKEIEGEQEFFESVFEVIENQLADKRRLKFWPLWHILFPGQGEPLMAGKSSLANRFKRIFEEVLMNYSSIVNVSNINLEILYWSALKSRIIEEKHMAELYKIIHNDLEFPHMFWYLRDDESAQSSLKNMLRSKNLNVARLAAVSLTVFRQELFPESWIGDQLWELTKEKQDIWRSRYIRGMAYCKLRWAEKCTEWLKAIKEAHTDELQDDWCQVIEKAGYCEERDRDAFFSLLLRIIKYGNTFSKPIRLAVLKRLYEMVSQIQPVRFNEKPLNLPLSRRARINLF